MEKKLIFLDIDGTLVSALSSPTPAVAEAIQNTRINGHQVFLSTGRDLAIIGQDILKLGFDGMIASAGAYVSVGDTILLDRLLPEELVQECFAALKHRKVFILTRRWRNFYVLLLLHLKIPNLSECKKRSDLVSICSHTRIIPDKEPISYVLPAAAWSRYGKLKRYWVIVLSL